jgi:hypothetical protein
MSVPGSNEQFPGSAWTERGFDAITVVAAENQVSSDFDGEAIVLELGKGMYYGLNAVATRVWELIQTSISANEIRDDLLETFEVERVRCETELMALLDDMWSRGLIEVTRRASTS